MNTNGLTHFDEQGQAIMVDVSGKKETHRTAVASGSIRGSQPVLQAIQEGTAGVARIAGIMAVKNTSSAIPLCHPLPIAKCSVDFELLAAECAIKAIVTVKVTGTTGVEMEALHGVSVTLLTIYDMCKAINKRMEITDIHLDKKSGGKSGEFIR